MNRNKNFTVVFGLAATLVVAGCGGDGGSMGAVPTPPPSRAATAPQPTKPGQPSKPASSAPKAACNGCFPGITYAGLVKTLKTEGYACKVDRILGTECEKGIMELHIDTDYKLKNQISNIDVTGRASSKGEYPQGPRVAFTRLKAALPVALPMVIADPAVRRQIIAFTAKNSSHPATGPDAVRDAKAGGFRISCQGVHGFTVRKNERSASSYSTSVSIYGPSAY